MIILSNKNKNSAYNKERKRAIEARSYEDEYAI
ncbi:MAG: hypothetical protein ACJAZZ_001374 [Dokdonia donghaensis]|jgi:hypothetical protein